jgi:molybdopterin synthase catalytic subunit
MVIHISVQEADFQIQDEYDELCQANAQDGAVVFFVGRVRDLNDNDNVYAMTLEHYPGMTEKSLHAIAEQARQRWPLNRIRIIHRVGRMLPADQIVFVAASSPHRQAAFAGVQFIMDYLKTQAPFWKKEETPGGSRWVEAKESDEEKAKQW